MKSLSCVFTGSSDYVSIKKAQEKALDLINFNFNTAPKKIGIKPNLCYYYDWSTGETTDPRFVAALIDILRERLHSDPEFSIVESDASAMRCKHVFRMLGYENMAKTKHVSLCNLSEEPYEVVDVEVANTFFKFRIPEIIRNFDMLLNIPKIKYMPIVKISCALKNMYGCNAYHRKHVYHKALNEAVVAVNKLVKSDLIVVDGITVLGTKTQNMGLILASEDPVSIDSAASTLLGFNPNSIRQITMAKQEGIGSPNYMLKGEKLSYVENLYPKRRMKDKIRLLIVKLYLRYLK